jgi:replicative superfamily II helicase
MGYSLDLSKISIDAYKEILKNQYLLPSRKILHQDIDSSFDAIHSCQIKNLAELKNALSTTQKLNVFSEKSGLSKDYLTILRREIGSIEPKIVLIKDFPEVDKETMNSLVIEGLKSSKDYYEFYYSLKDKNDITQKLSISNDKAQELISLCNLVRINGVGAVAAKSFFDAGYKSINEVANTTAEEMLERVLKVNDIKQYYKAKLGTKDMQFCIGFARIIANLENL